MGRRLLPPVTAIIALASSITARGSPSARLVYYRTSDAALCPDETVLRKAVASRFGYDPFFQWAQTTIVVHVSRERGPYTARVHIIDSRGLVRGTREISSDESDCSELFDATALAISIALDASQPAAPASSASGSPGLVPPSQRDPTGTMTPPPHGPAAGTAPSTEGLAHVSQPPAHATHRTAERAPTLESSSSPPHTPGVRLVVGASIGWALGIAPASAPGIAGFFELRPRSIAPFSIGAEPFAYLSLASEASQFEARGSIRVGLFGGNIAPCIRGTRVFACGVTQLAMLQAWRTDATRPRSDGTLHLAAGGRLGMDWPLTEALFARVQAELLVNVRPPVFEVDYGDSWPAPRIFGILGVGLGTHFP